MWSMREGRWSLGPVDHRDGADVAWILNWYVEGPISSKNRKPKIRLIIRSNILSRSLDPKREAKELDWENFENIEILGLIDRGW